MAKALTATWKKQTAGRRKSTAGKSAQTVRKNVFRKGALILLKRVSNVCVSKRRNIIVKTKKPYVMKKGSVMKN